MVNEKQEKKSSGKKDKGFTLLEIIIVLILISFIISILIILIKPGRIFQSARDKQRVSDLESLSSATQIFLSYYSFNRKLKWIERGRCEGASYDYPGYTFFSVILDYPNNPPIGWPGFSSPYHVATGTELKAVDGTGWLPLNFSKISILNLSQLPVDPLNGKIERKYYSNTLFYIKRAYSFSCDNKFNYEFATFPEDPFAIGADKDGGNISFLYEVGPGKSFLYPFIEP